MRVPNLPSLKVWNPPAPKVLGRDLPDGTRKRLQVYLGGGIFRPKPPVFDRSWRSPSKNTVKNSTKDTCSWTRPSKIGKRNPSCHECHACHAKKSRWEFVRRLPRKKPVDVGLCHVCHANCPGAKGDQIRLSEPVPWVPRLPQKMMVDLSFFAACHEKLKIWGCATPNTQIRMDISLCRACHAKCRRGTGNQIRPSASPSTMSTAPSAICATPATQRDGRCECVPHLPRKIDLIKCRSCVWYYCVLILCVCEVKKNPCFSTFWPQFFGLQHLFLRFRRWPGPEADFWVFGPVFGLIFVVLW